MLRKYYICGRKKKIKNLLIELDKTVWFVLNVSFNSGSERHLLLLLSPKCHPVLTDVACLHFPVFKKYALFAFLNVSHQANVSASSDQETKRKKICPQMTRMKDCFLFGILILLFIGVDLYWSECEEIFQWWCLIWKKYKLTGPWKSTNITWIYSQWAWLQKV